MESSDDSFAWMSTSSDSNDSNTEDFMMTAVKTKSEEGDSTDNKKTVHKRLFDGERSASGGEEAPPHKRRNKLKRERAETPAPAAPASDSDSDSDCASANAELARRARQELTAPAGAGRAKREPASDSDGAGAELARRARAEREPAAAPARADPDAFVREKNKSKKRKKETSLKTDIKDMIVEDSFSAEETVVESRSRPKKVSDSLTRLNRTEVDDEASSTIKTCTSREFVSDDSSSSDENCEKKKKKLKNKCRNSELQHKSSDNEERQIEATPVQSLERAQHKPKISDRIRYEDEDDSQIENNHQLTNGRPEHSGTHAQSTRLKRFLESNPQLKLVTPYFDGDSSVTRDDQVWVLRCPHDVDISNLKGKDLQLDTKCKLKIDGQAHDGSLNEEKGTVAMLSCQNNQIIINNTSLIGTVNFHKRIPKPHFVEDNVIVNNQTNFIPLPDTKCRHPLFGSDYKKAIKIPSAIKARLKVEHEPKLEQSEKKKKKKHREQEYEAETAAASSHEAAAPRHEHERRRRRRHAAPADQGDEPPPKKTKKIKTEVSADTWESVKAIEESLFDF